MENNMTQGKEWKAILLFSLPVAGSYLLQILYNISDSIIVGNFVGADALGGGALTQFERLCDNALTAHVSQARRVPFGEQPLIGYLYARESELTAIRVILTGRLAGLDTETIRERLRESYV